MNCPHCNQRYDHGVTVCPICKTPLNDEAGGERIRNIKFVTVYEGGDPAFLAFAKSVLQSEGIAYYFKGEGLQDLEGAGRLGAGFNPIFGPVEIQVDEKDAQRARDILIQIEKDQNTTPESEKEDSTPKENFPHAYINEKKSMKGIAWGVAIGILISVAASYLYDAMQRYRQTNHSWMSYADTNKDGKDDMFYYYEKGELARMEEDRNYDGKIDGKYFYKQGIVDCCFLDENYDGVFESKYYYQKGILHQAVTDLNEDKNPEIIDDYVDGVIYKSAYYHEVTNKIWKIEFYRSGVIREEHMDQDDDGVLDIAVRYNSTGRPVNKEKLSP